MLDALRIKTRRIDVTTVAARGALPRTNVRTGPADRGGVFEVLIGGVPALGSSNPRGAPKAGRCCPLHTAHYGLPRGPCFATKGAPPRRLFRVAAGSVLRAANTVSGSIEQPLCARLQLGQVRIELGYGLLFCLVGPLFVALPLI